MVFYSKGIDFNRFKLDLDKKYKYNCDKQTVCYPFNDIIIKYNKV